MSPAKKAEMIEIPFGLRTWIGPRKHVRGMGRGSFEGEKKGSARCKI